MRSEDSGISIIELCVAMMVMTVALMGVAGSMGAGLSLVGHGRQRSAGAEVAQQAIESIRTTPYVYVALSTAPTHSPNASNPDYAVNGGTYDSDASGSLPPETLVVTGGGLVSHSNDTSVGPTKFSVFRYVTWVDDPGIPSTACPSSGTTCDYKRVVVVVQWPDQAKAGSTAAMTQSTFVTDGTITLAETAVTPAPAAVADHLTVVGTTTPVVGESSQFTVSAVDTTGTVVPAYLGTVHFTSTDTAATLPNDYTFAPRDDGTRQFNVTFRTANAQTLTISDLTNASVRSSSITVTVTPPPCPGDSIAPTGSVSFVNTTPTKSPSTPVKVQVLGVDTGFNGGPCGPLSVELSNDQSTWTTASSSLVSGTAAQLDWLLSSGDGPKTVYARFHDKNGTASAIYTSTNQILVDTTPPPAPAALTFTCKLNGSPLGVTLTWTATAEVGGSGVKNYTVLRNGAVLMTTAATTYLDVPVSLGAYAYSVTTNDNAGNVSTPSPSVSVNYIAKKDGGSC